jgi:adenylate cyclase
MSSAAVKARNGAPPGGLSLQEAAERVGVAASALRRWARAGVIAPYDASWSSAAVSHARIVARLRERARSPQSIRRASEEGRLAFGYVEELFDTGEEAYSLREAARQTGLEPALVARVADAEVRLFHLYVHEPRMRSGATGVETAEEMLDLTRRLLPLSSPVMDHVHQRCLQHFVEQDVVGHMESDLEGDSIDLGRMRVAIAFADLTGYTRLTEEAGELEAVDVVERFVDAVESSLPDDARVIKTIGDEVMVVGSDPVALTEWAVAFQRLQDGRTLPRIAIHYGNALYRDGDYYGRDVNIASRVAARAAGGEVLVTRPVVERAGGELAFDRIAEVRLKGFTESTEVFIARERDGG